jgi:prophage antirepressor-like protein
MKKIDNKDKTDKAASTHIALFKGKTIRKIIHNNEWWFSVVDVCEALTGSERPRKYWNDLKNKILEEGYFELSEKIGRLKLLSSDGKFYSTDCANTETMFRIIQTSACDIKRACTSIVVAYAG